MDRQIYDRMRQIETDHWWFRGRRKVLEHLVACLPLEARSTILEVGCGTGGNLKMLSRFGEVTGMEPDAEARTWASEHSGVAVVDGRLPARLPFTEASFDLIAAFDVIEHVDDDAGTVRAVANLLKPNGYIVATVPAHPWMWSRHDELHHHKRRYRIGPFRRLFDQAGLEVLKASYFNTFLFPLIATVRLLKTALGVGGGDDDVMPPEPLNGALAALFGAERHWLGRSALPFGVSVVVIAQRP